MSTRAIAYNLELRGVDIYDAAGNKTVDNGVVVPHIPNSLDLKTLKNVYEYTVAFPNNTDPQTPFILADPGTGNPLTVYETHFFDIFIAAVGTVTGNGASMKVEIAYNSVKATGEASVPIVKLISAPVITGHIPATDSPIYNYDHTPNPFGLLFTANTIKFIFTAAAASIWKITVVDTVVSHTAP